MDTVASMVKCVQMPRSPKEMAGIRFYVPQTFRLRRYPLESRFAVILPKQKKGCNLENSGKLKQKSSSEKRTCDYYYTKILYLFIFFSQI